ncbi:PorP/SprF family type IX secretion system membrane protein [Marivirga sp. S37H4]|uniref:PorP/SprF family type IX secretion system membrane protein n=1 Tax=Marivirga aurantiaca TaxID=2802615 RepID=A0A934X0N5_9BACT|nr:PorP/SprF family type IX secretion system membrane protein [Marivirga aurantiaca]MBK6266509.1 PorP/SprF family type IX secretion system membrane protein [Marivirga aurantiaca]
MRKISLILGCLTAILYGGLNRVVAQDLPVYNQFYFNPFLYNPAFLGINEGTEINSVYRQQWLGIEDAPINSSFTLQHTGNSNVSLGLTLQYESAVLLQKNAFLITYGYKLPLGHEHSLSFGISGGIGRYGLDLSQIDTSDPALQGAGSNTYYADGNFGFLYDNRRWQLSFAVNNIFDANPYSQDNLSNLKFSNLKSLMGSVSYEFLFNNPSIVFKPYLLYRTGGKDFQQAEAAGVFYYQDKIWAGGAYRYQSNPALFVGFNLLENLKLSYSYEFPPAQFDAVQAGSHELMFSYHIGSKVKRRELEERVAEKQLDKKDAKKFAKIRAAQKLEKDLKREIEFEQKGVVDSVAEVDKESVIPNDTLIVGLEEKMVEKSNEPDSSFNENTVEVLSKGYYVVIAVFNYQQNAVRFQAKMKKEGFHFKMGLNPAKQFFYVYKISTDDLEEANRIKLTYSKIKQFSDVWIYKME